MHKRRPLNLRLPTHGRVRRPPREPLHWQFWTPCWLRGGLEAVTLAHLKYLVGRGHRVSLVAGWDSDMRDELPPECEYHLRPDVFDSVFPPTREHMHERFVGAFRLVTETNPDIIVTGLTYSPHFSFRASKTPLVVEYFHGGTGWSCMAKPSDFGVAVSADARERVRRMRSMMPPTAVVSNGADPSLFQWVGEKIQKPEFPEDSLVIGWSARMSPEKKADLWLLSVARMKHLNPRIIGYMMGSEHDGKYGHVTNDLAQKMGLVWGRDIFRAEAPHSEMWQHYGAMDVLLHCCDIEGFGMAPVEALLCGTPVVIPDRAGCYEVARLAGPRALTYHRQPEIEKQIQKALTAGRLTEAEREATVPNLCAERMCRAFEDVCLTRLEELKPQWRGSADAPLASRARRLPREPLHWQFWSPCWERGGTEALTLIHIKHLLSRGYRVSLVVGTDSAMRDEVPAECDYRFAPECFDTDADSLLPDRTQRCIDAALPIVQETQPDIAVGTFTFSPFYAFRRGGVPLVIEYWHSQHWSPLDKPSDLAICISQFMLEEVRARRTCLPPLEVLVNGTDPGLFPYAGTREPWNGVPASSPVIGFAGRLAEEKRPGVWLECVARMKAQDPNVVGLMVGSHWEKPVGQVTIAKAESLGLAWGRDVFRAELPHSEMWRAYAAMDVLLHCSRVEPFGLVLVEALFCGTPVVAHDGCGSEEIAQIVGGTLVGTHHNDEHVHCLLREALAGGRLSQAERNGVVESLSAERMAQDFERIVTNKLAEVCPQWHTVSELASAPS